MVVRIGGIRKFTFDVSNKNGTAHREFGRNQVEFVRLQSLRKKTGEGIGKRGRLALVFYLRIIIVCRRLSTTYAKLRSKDTLRLVWAVRYKVSFNILLYPKENFNDRKTALGIPEILYNVIYSRPRVARTVAASNATGGRG